MAQSITEQMNAQMEIVNTEVEKFNGGNKAAGTRARKAALELKKLADLLRKGIQAKKNEG
jgi:hypothetical protein